MYRTMNKEQANKYVTKQQHTQQIAKLCFCLTRIQQINIAITNHLSLFSLSLYIYIYTHTHIYIYIYTYVYMYMYM